MTVAAVHAALGIEEVGELERAGAHLLTHAPHAGARAELLAAPEERRRLRALGLERVAGLSWDKTARTLLDLFTRTSP